MQADPDRLCPDGAHPEGSGERAPQRLPAPDPEVFEQARAALAAAKGKGRRDDGTAATGNTLAMKNGVHSQAVLSLPEVAGWHREQVAAITADLGGESELSTLQRAAVREVARLELILGNLGENVFVHGPLTGKGKTRAATTNYLKTLDRFVKLAGLLGLTRRPKPAESFAGALRDAAAATSEEPK